MTDVLIFPNFHSSNPLSQDESAPDTRLTIRLYMRAILNTYLLQPRLGLFIAKGRFSRDFLLVLSVRWIGHYVFITVIIGAIITL